MFNINFCSNTRKRFQRDFRIAAVAVRKDMDKKAEDERKRAAERRAAIKTVVP